MVYFLAGIVLPYGMFISSKEIPSFLAKFIDNGQIDATAAMMAMAFCVTILSSLVKIKGGEGSSRSLPIPPNSIFILGYFSIIFFCLYIAISIAFAGSIQGALLSAYARVRTNSTLANIRAIFFWGCLVFTTFAFYGMRSTRVSIKTKFIVYLCLILSSILAMLDGGRAVLILFFLSLFFRFILTASRAKLISFIIISLFVVSLVSYVMISIRYQTQNAVIAENGDIPISEALNGLAFLDHIQVSRQYADDVGHDYGYVYLNAAISFLPRSIFPWKAVPLSAQMRGYLFGDETGGVPPGIFGEAYIFAGISGVLLISVIYGRLLAASASLCRRAAKAESPTSYAIAGVMVPMVGFTLVRGGFDIGVIRVGIPFLWCLIALKIVKFKLRKNPSKLSNDRLSKKEMLGGKLCTQ